MNFVLVYIIHIMQGECDGREVDVAMMSCHVRSLDDLVVPQ